MNCEQCIDQLGNLVDGAIDPEISAQLDEHCRGCDACRDLLNDLREIRAAAATLERFTPSPAVWSAIAATVSAPPSRRYSWVELAAAAALAVMLGTAGWFALGPRGHAGGDSPENLARNAASELHLAEQHYLNAITALEQLTIRSDAALDPAVAAEIAQSLQSIDRAIADSREALKTQPDSLVAQTSLLEALRMKVAVLQETVSLMNSPS